MASISAGDLRSRVTVMRRVPGKNALGEDTYDYKPDRKVWARILPRDGESPWREMWSGRRSPTG